MPESLAAATNYFILDAPVASPAKCGCCGYSGSDRKYLDPRLDFEFYGSLILCEMCVGAMANDFGFLQPAQSRNLEARLTEAESELTILRTAIIHLENAHDALGDLHSLFGRSDPVSVPDSEPEAELKLLSLAIGSGSISSTIEPDGNSTLDELVSVEGSDDVPESADTKHFTV